MIRAISIASTLAFATPALAIAPSPAEEAALQTLAHQADVAWNRKDVQAMIATYADGSSLRVGVEAAGQLNDRESIERYFNSAFARRAGEFRHITQIDGIDMLDSAQGLTESIVRVEVRSAEGGWKLARLYRTLSLAVRTPTGWKLRWVRAIPLS